MKKHLHLFIKTLSQNPHARGENNVMTQAKDINGQYKNMMTRLAEKEAALVDEMESDKKMEASSKKHKKTLEQLAKE